ncbi:MAG: cation:proton antiporter [Deltaproteobacteria bacterium]|nr:cation:proton antiporter [Deltaproteobacteria bacterium]
MNPPSQKTKNIFPYLLSLVIISCIAIWLLRLESRSGWHHAGLINLSLGFVLLTAHFSAQVLKAFRLPLISGYIITGILAGPYVSNLLSFEMVDQLRLADSLALSFIALTAGGSLHLASLKTRFRTILLTISFLTFFVFGFIFLFVSILGRHFSLFSDLPTTHITVLAILLGIIAIARSPSSAIAIIKESRAKGTFTETVLGVTVVMDVLIILFFTFAITISKAMMLEGAAIDLRLFSALFIEITASIATGAILGKLIAFYIERAGQDILLFLLFIAFGVTRISLWFSGYMAGTFNIYLHLEPLLICMSAGFFVQNFSRSGSAFMENLDRMALPIFVLFFSLAGASLNLHSLMICWPFAICIVLVRIIGIFAGTFLAGKISHDPPAYCRNSWMAYLTQAGIAIGLAQLAGFQFPEIGDRLITVVLAVIAINQLIGPITFKIVLNLVGESDRS